MEESKITEKAVPAPEVRPLEKNTRYRWLVNWVSLLTTVFLFASALNCLFLWLAYNNKHDAAGLAFSLVLALIVYFQVFSARMASLPRRLFLSVTMLMIWSVFMPIIMHLAGLK